MKINKYQLVGTLTTLQMNFLNKKKIVDIMKKILQSFLKKKT